MDPLQLIKRALLVVAIACLPSLSHAQSLGGGPITTAGADCSVFTRCFDIDTRGVESFGVYLNVGTSGTFNWEVSTDALTLTTGTWVAIGDDVNGASSATVDGLYYFSNPGYARWRVRASAINGAATVAAAQGYSGLRSTATLSGAAQGDGTIQDGVNSAIEITVADLTNSNPAATMIVDANGTQITAFGGGVQYTEADVDATITGTALLAEGAGNTLIAVPGTVANGLLVDVSRIVAALPAGTNNIGDVDVLTLPALPAGANDIGNFNLEFGGTAAATNTGTSSAQTIRTVTASNSPDVTALELIDDIRALEDAAAGSGYAGVPVLFHRLDAYSATAADNDFVTPTIDGASGGVRVAIVAGAGSGGTAIADGATITPNVTSFTPVGGLYEASPSACVSTDGCIVGVTQSRTLRTTLYSAAGTELLLTDQTLDAAIGTSGPMMVGRGSAATPTAMSTDNDATAIWLDLNGRVNIKGTYREDDPHTTLDVGMSVLGRRIDTLAPSSGASGDYEIFNMTALGSVWNTPTGYARAGATPISMLSDGTNNDDETAVCTGPCTIYSVFATNHSAASVFLRCEADTTANTVPGSETPAVGEFDWEIPGSTANPAGLSHSFPMGVFFDVAYTCWLSTGEASSDTTDPTADDVRVTFTRSQ